MQQRVRKAERIVDVQRQMHRIETWRLEELKRGLADMEAALAGIIEALNSEGALHGLFLEQTAKRLRLLAEQASRTGREIDAQATVVLDRGTKLKTAERHSDGVADAYEKDQDRKELQDVIERAVAAARDASLP